VTVVGDIPYFDSDVVSKVTVIDYRSDTAVLTKHGRCFVDSYKH
jgi:hypothetical protein